MYESPEINLPEEQDSGTAQSKQPAAPFQDELASDRAGKQGKSGNISAINDGISKKDRDAPEDDWLLELLGLLAAGGGIAGLSAYRRAKQPTAPADAEMSLNGRAMNIKPGQSVAVKLSGKDKSTVLIPTFQTDPKKDDRCDLLVSRDKQGQWNLLVPKDTQLKSITIERANGTRTKVSNGKIQPLNNSDKLILGTDGPQLRFSKARRSITAILPESSEILAVTNCFNDQRTQRIITIPGHKPIKLDAQGENLLETKVINFIVFFLNKMKRAKKVTRLKAGAQILITEARSQ